MFSLADKIRDVYINSGYYEFDSELETMKFIQNAVFWLESDFNEYRDEFDSIKEYFHSDKADKVLYYVAQKDYEWIY